ncbi:MAG: Gfo/Idh/MocA family oxidoreductase [Clostridia bacterium]|nr:Gfo/Idh/MocA family oxidoreductase [Clostridia bacterium]
MTEPLKLLTVGTSWITESFLESAVAAGFGHFAAYSRTEEKARAFAEKHGAKKIFTSLEEAAACPEIDCVYIASPNVFHFPQAKLFLEHAKHVIVEKPICTYPEQIEELYRIADENGVIVCEALMPQHVPALQTVRAALPELGVIRSVQLDYSQLSSKYAGYLRGEKQNIFQPEMQAGCLQDLGVYAVSVAYLLFGSPVGVKADAVMLPTGADAAFSAILSYPDKTVTISCSKTAQTRAPSQILGDRGAILIESVSQLTGIRLIANDGGERVLEEIPSRFEVMKCEAEDFYAYILGLPARVPYKEARAASLRVSEIMRKIRLSAGNFAF